MSAVPQNANDVVLQLSRLSRELDERTKDLNEADVAAVNAREAAKLAEAQEFLKAEGSVDARKCKAIVATPELRLAAEVAEAGVRGLQRTIRTLQTRIDVGRTYGATIRSEAALAGSGVHGA
ncbi:hypothetical protein NDR87_18860 [Nocardia sp. CDC159]|uniref:Uncharacterized protein n=1 Tax=Nocardia pulmonis TaxID=2951408 RepID=A0A9X2EDJ4_9NOCA|nr:MULTISPECIES: hypothetical protein [Nocardia]MCM6776248.1 hypothetical protein [Nocardia pulmonis]MCM6788426.1 hypothetical protein [Nocardia sp. CDC159]